MSTDIQSYHDAQSPHDKTICERLRTEIDRILSGATSKIWHRHPVWFLAENPIVGYSKRKRGICLMFWSGQSFDEAGLSPEGTFKAAEIFYTDPDQIVIPDLHRWLDKSRRIQWDYKNIAKRKGLLERLDVDPKERTPSARS